ncbi:hypothetical protein [Cellulomonas sp. ES6]|nr:hypothetical protein [Cellulomonas sp. ES6]WHP17854.1 hypothetical protein P9841_01395 [Cellulomonas sp. ES6]
MDLTGAELFAQMVTGTAVAVAVGTAVALLYKVREWSGAHG